VCVWGGLFRLGGEFETWRGSVSIDRSMNRRVFTQSGTAEEDLVFAFVCLTVCPSERACVRACVREGDFSRSFVRSFVRPSPSPRCYDDDVR